MVSREELIQHFSDGMKDAIAGEHRLPTPINTRDRKKYPQTILAEFAERNTAYKGGHACIKAQQKA